MKSFLHVLYLLPHTPTQGFITNLLVLSASLLTPRNDRPHAPVQLARARAIPQRRAGGQPLPHALVLLLRGARLCQHRDGHGRGWGYRRATER